MTTLILGATGGIGTALARVWPDRPLILSGRNDAHAQFAADLGATFLRADVGYESHVQKLFEAVSELDTLIYAVGTVAPEPLASASGEATRRVWNANYFGAVWTLKHGLPKLRAGGRAYVLGARPELVTARGFAQYAASKAALGQAVEVARLEHRALTLTLVLPPAVDTGLWSAVGKVPRGAVSPDVIARAMVEDRAGPGVFELRAGDS